MTRILLLSFIILLGCNSKSSNTKTNNKYTKFFAVADSISISFNYQDGLDTFRTSSVHKKEKSLINSFGEVFNKDGSDCSCKAVGFIDVYKKDSITLSVEIGQPGATSSTDLKFLKVHEGDSFFCYTLGDKLSQYLAEYRDLMK